MLADGPAGCSEVTRGGCSCAWNFSVTRSAVFTETEGLDQGWRVFLRARAQIVCKFPRNSRAHKHFEGQNKVLEPFLIIVNYLLLMLVMIIIG